MRPTFPFLASFLAAALGFDAEPAFAQAPARPAPPFTEPAIPSDGEIRLRSETQEKVGPGHFQFRGFVDVKLGDLRFQADKMDVYEVTRPDGSKGHRVVAEGNVVFLRGEERISARRLEMDDTGKGFFEDAIGFVEPGVFVEGRRIDRLDEKHYKVEGGKFSSCAQPNPRWAFSSSSADITVGDHILARNAVFKIKSVPAFYTPLIYYPIREDQRSTGFLFPHFGYSNTKGWNAGSGFFWAMGRSWDQTFYADYYSEIGYGLGHEFRYVQRAPSRATFRTYVYDPTKIGGEWDWDLDWNALQILPGNVRATVNVRQYSNLLFQQRFQDNFYLATTRTRRAFFSLQRNFGGTTLSASADSTGTYYGDDYRRINQHLPTFSVRRFPKRVGRTPLTFGFEGTAENLGLGDEIQVDRYSRFDVWPTVSLPLSLSFLQVTPRAAYRYTRWGTSYTVDAEGLSTLTGPGLDRSFFEGGVDLRGPTFSRVFNTPGGAYTDRFKHVIGPEVNWTYVTRVDDFNLIPKFDGHDYILGTNQVNYGIVQRFLAKRPGPAGKSIPYEFLTWRVYQTYYVQINEGQNNFDPNYSSAAYGPAGAEHLSPLVSRVRVRPSPLLSADFLLEYDVNFKQFRRRSINAGLNGSRGSLTGGWSKSSRLGETAEERVTVANTLNASASLQVVPGKLSLSANGYYDFVNKILYTIQGRLRYDVQCCGFNAEYIRYDYNGRQERQFRFSIELANVGSIGNFNGIDALGRQQGLGMYR